MAAPRPQDALSNAMRIGFGKAGIRRHLESGQIFTLVGIRLGLR